MEIKDNIRGYPNNSNLKYNRLGQMYFDDLLYVTKWTVQNHILHSETQFVYLEPEQFNFDSSTIESLKTGLNHNGFLPEYDEILSPYHRNKHLELYFVTKGSLRIKVQKDFYTLNTGSALFINSNTNHSDVISWEPLELYIIGFNENFFQDNTLQAIQNTKFRHFINQSFKVQYKDSEAWFIDTKDGGQFLRHYTELIRDELAVRTIGYADMVRIASLRILDGFSKETTTIVKDSGRNHKLLVFHEVTQYLEHYYGSASLTDLADYLKFSKSYFNRIIKEVSGKTYTDLLQEVRIEKAKEMLRKTDEPIMEIAQKVGYTNMTYFYELFKSMTGVTPKEYREKTI
ncbi:YesN/AraC family two-component response regulator [Enterococcus rotai]|uniref:HTH araC/xylS-type domain-containing protein n=1 Tax=Enterococcus rotai TaxID=118060 RepID=A0A0U2VVK3_9ENTE|nr:AraC family transcriptional regulator [Enterococcus rotai]ALS37332.1 hypothetical protein ATZ35_09230 [Enterococcus rotai]